LRPRYSITIFARFSFWVDCSFTTRRDTKAVIAHTRHKVPLNRDFGSTPITDIAIASHNLAPPAAEPASPIHADVGRYRLRLAESAEDREAACRLRFKVFNIELGEGLECSYDTGLDMDRFDTVCEHLLVEDKTSQRVVGTYRMQSGDSAARHLGYYSEQEFYLAPYEPLRPGILELGRASIDREHRTPEVLMLLWRGIAQYATGMGLRYLLGCSSLNSNDPAEGWQMYRQLENFRVPREFETAPTTCYACPLEPQDADLQDADAQPTPCQTDRSGFLATPAVQSKVPKLLKTYLAIGARIAAPPAWDREFRTIDFLTLLDLKSLSAAARNRFLAPLTS
jgi:putative hemolysin